VSSTELSLNDILSEEQRMAGGEGWQMSYVKTEEEIVRAREIAMTETEFMPRMMAVGRLGLAVNLLDRFKANFLERGVLDNDLLGVPHESLRDVITRVRTQGRTVHSQPMLLVSGKLQLAFP
jgi:hypothetical protein